LVLKSSTLPLASSKRIFMILQTWKSYPIFGMATLKNWLLYQSIFPWNKKKKKNCILYYLKMQNCTENIFSSVSHFEKYNILYQHVIYLFILCFPHTLSQNFTKYTLIIGFTCYIIGYHFTWIIGVWV
jgi:hypothetical protein